MNSRNRPTSPHTRVARWQKRHRQSLPPGGRGLTFEVLEGRRVLASVADVEPPDPGHSAAVVTLLMPGDANQDLKFDQRDLVQVQQAGKYLTDQPATWEEGDWNGDGVFDQEDIVAALQTGTYLEEAAVDEAMR